MLRILNGLLSNRSLIFVLQVLLANLAPSSVSVCRCFRKKVKMAREANLHHNFQECGCLLWVLYTVNGTHDWWILAFFPTEP